MVEIDFSLIICTYNPDERILRRCLQAVSALDFSGIKTEVLLVDNNSTTRVSSLECVKDLSPKLPGFQFLFIAEQGVRYARMAAIKASRGKFIVYFDYDNEPEKSYLQSLLALHTRFPNVGAWGPGDVTVDFIDGVSRSLEPYARRAFQERHDTAIGFSSKPSWEDCYPFGTGLCTEAAQLKDYVAQAEKGKLTLSGRKGNLVTSGEDTQMVLNVVKNGKAAGSSPTLKLVHIIPKDRANVKYLRKLAYGTSVCYDSCILQVFPEQRAQIESHLIGSGAFAGKALARFLAVRWQPDPKPLFALIQSIGMQAGTYQALNKKLPPVVQQIIRSLKLA